MTFFSVLQFLRVWVFAVWYGSLIWHSFISGIILLKSIPRKEFGDAQAKLFPAYFFVSGLCSLTLAAMEYAYLLPNPLSNSYFWSLLVSLALTAVQALVVGPNTTRLMRERARLEKDAASTKESAAKFQAVSKEFSKAHGVSSSLNLVVIIAATYYIGHLAFATGF